VRTKWLELVPARATSLLRQAQQAPAAGAVALPQLARSRSQLGTGGHFCSGRIVSSDLASSSRVGPSRNLLFAAIACNVARQPTPSGLRIEGTATAGALIGI
jgi:hypothetical protein